jgi:hypothetical protein
MNRTPRNKIKWAIATGLFVILCSAWALVPLWLNPCVPSYLSEEEIERFLDQYGSKYITSKEQTKIEQQYREEEIPCGAQDLPVREKLEVARFQGMILSELRNLRPIILRVEFVGMVENTDLYHYKGYTFFFIPILDGRGGGSGYMEIIPFPFLHEVK